MKKTIRAADVFKKPQTALAFFVAVALVLSIIICALSPGPQAEAPAPPEVVAQTKGTVALHPSEGGTTLPAAAEQTLSDFYTAYFNALAELRHEDISAYFGNADTDAAEAGALDQVYLDYLIEMRAAQPVDLKMNDYAVDLNITSAEPLEDGSWMVTVSENQGVHFALSPETLSESRNIENVFRLAPQGDTYKIIRHTRDEDAFLMLHDAYIETGETAEARLPQLAGIKERFQKNAAAENAAQQQARQAAQSAAPVRSEGNYNRAAAVDYAARYAFEHNPAYAYYGDTGGNCNNFISQALAAGGIAEDTSGNYWWEHEDPTGSWILVDDFYTYAAGNSEGGFLADLNANLYQGEPGDVLQYGSENNWKHSVLIADTIKDADGNTVDYLIDSNTADRKNYPASAYGYPQLRLIHVVKAQ